MDARPQVERGTAGLKLSVTAKPYNYEIEHLNPLPLSASPAPAPQTWLTSPQWLQQQATQPALGNLQAVFRAETGKKHFRFCIQKFSSIQLIKQFIHLEFLVLVLNIYPRDGKICFKYQPLNLATLRVTGRLFGEFSEKLCKPKLSDPVKLQPGWRGHKEAVQLGTTRQQHNYQLDK